MPDINLSAELRTEFGKGAARRIRRADKIPAVLYGHGSDPLHITLPGHQTLLALRQHNVLLTIQVPGWDSRLALPKQIQRDPIKGLIEHVDLLLVRRGEKVTVDVSIVLTGEHHPDAMIMMENSEVAVDAEATNIPGDIQVSVEGLEPGTQILAKDLVLPEGVTLAVDEDHLIVNIVQAPTQEQLEAEEEAEAEAEGEEPEGEAGDGDEGTEDESESKD